MAQDCLLVTGYLALVTRLVTWLLRLATQTRYLTLVTRLST